MVCITIHPGFFFILAFVMFVFPMFFRHFLSSSLLLDSARAARGEISNCKKQVMWTVSNNDDEDENAKNH